MIKLPGGSRKWQEEAAEFLGRRAPFDRMAKSDRQFLASRVGRRTYSPGEAVVRPDDGPADRLFIVRQGRVTAALRSGDAEEAYWDLVRGECFPIGALVAGRAVSVIVRASEATVCYELSRFDFESLRRRSPEFNEFCTQRLASLLDLALRDRQASLARRAGAGSLASPLAAMVRRLPVACPPATPLAQALLIMQDERVGSIVVIDEQERPCGVFTLHDLLAQVALGGVALERPITEVMTPEPLTLGSDKSGFDAVLLMADRGFAHVCVTEGGRLRGVLSERDFFALRRLGLVPLRRSIAQARDVESLAGLSSDIHALIEQMLAQGASIEQLTQIITALNDHITRRVIDLTLEQTGRPRTPFSWVAFGSEGRNEQTLKTDQDNGILFEATAETDEESARAELLPLAARINGDLGRCGLPLCSGKVMASNPEWCLSRREWSERFETWVHQADGKMLLYASIFFDFRTVYGPEEPVEELRKWLLAICPGHRGFFRRMVDNALSVRPPIGMLREFVLKKSGDHANTLDLKLNGITPFVDAARIFALYAGLGETNTPRRLREAGLRWQLDAKKVEAWVGAFEVIQRLRLRQQLEQLAAGGEPSNFVDPSLLGEMERRVLKDAFHQGRKLQRKMETFFQF